MFLKVIAIIAFIGICQAGPTDHHAYSSQSIVVHHEHKEHKHEPEHHKVEEHKEHKHEPEHHKVEEHKEEPKYEYHEHKYEPHEHKHVIKHEHKHEVKHEVKHEEKHEQKHEDNHEQKKNEYKHEHKKEHKPAISSQHIERHDIPAHPPKGFNDHHGHAKYEFSYQVHDPHTHDVKEQHETRDGHSVHGVYSLHEADGSIRTVKYSADKKTGFEADVKHTTKHVEEHKHHQ